MRLAAEAMELAAEALESTDKRVDPTKVVGRAAKTPEAGELGQEATRERFGGDMYELKIEAMSSREIAGGLRDSAMALRRRADAKESPDQLADILTERMERGFAFLPPELVRSLYRLGRSVNAARRGEATAQGAAEEAVRLADSAAEWAESMDDRRLEEQVLCRIEPEVPF